MSESGISKNDVPLEASLPEAAVSLESILCTEELHRRPWRPPDFGRENRALVALASALADSPRTILQTLAETILDVTQSDSAGLSLLTTDDGGKRFYWPAIAGIWKPHIGGGTPRNFGPCGDVLDRDIPLLFRHFERRYPYLLPVMPPAAECLLVPFYVGGKAVGTIWAITHDDSRKFDAEDERLMSVLGQFASLAYQNLVSIDDLKFQIAEREKAESALRELTDALETRVRVRTEELEQEIAERKRAEEESRRSEAYLAEAQRRFEGILDIAEDAIVSVDSNQRIVLFNQGAEKVFGYVADDVLGQPLDILLPQRFAPVHRGHIEAFAKAPEVSRLMGQRREVFGCRKDGHEFPAEASISKLDLGGELVFTVILRDITGRKRAEQRLVAQHTVTQVLAEAASLEEATPKLLQAVCECLVWDLGELWRIDRAAGVLRCVEVWHKESIEAPQFEATSHERTFMPGIGLPGRVWSSREPAYIPDVVQDSNFPRTPIAAREGLHAAFAFPILLGSEVIGVMDFFSREIRQPDQDLLDMMATIGSQIGQFIERKRAEEGLRRSEAYLAEAQRLSLTGSFGWKLSSGELIWSKETFCILEYDHATKPTLELVFTRVHPEDIALVQQTIDRASRDGTDLDFEHRLLMPDGSIKYVHVVAHGVRDGTDTIEFVGAVSDVTEAKKAEEQIRQDERELRQIVEAIPALILVLAPDGSPLYANERVLEYAGLTRKDFQAGDFPKLLFHPSDVDRLRDKRRQALARGVSFELEKRARRKDGQYRWFIIRYEPLLDDQGHVIRWYGTGTDIDDRKRAEERARNENLALREEIDKTSMFEEIVGASPILRSVLARVAKVAPTDSTVLITGETGTGKELIARAIHKRSPRAARAFLSVNCAAVPPALIASELFGHEKGAFTGALQRRPGRFELAEGGTLFLDEIGGLPSETQIALLRVLQEREFERVGGTQMIRADVRVIAAANCDLQAAIATGAFRSDLFYRLNVFPIEMPPLRERQEDIPLLVEYFVERYARKAGEKFQGVNTRTLELLQAYPWPGNIRELQNVIERSVIVCETEIFSVDESWLSRQTLPPQPASLALSKGPVTEEKAIIEAALAATRGRVSGPSGAAAKLGLPPSTLESKIRALKINKHRFKTV
jgi:PAS domain S-box-containing protein